MLNKYPIPSTDDLKSIYEMSPTKSCHSNSNSNNYDKAPL